MEQVLYRLANGCSFSGLLVNLKLQKPLHKRILDYFDEDIEYLDNNEIKNLYPEKNKDNWKLFVRIVILYIM